MADLPCIKFEENRLDNGLQVVVCPDHSVPLVHVSLHYGVGSSYESLGFSGFAHLFEHMMFQGSKNVPKNGHGRYVDNAGGSWNASTSKDRTNYYETVPSHFMELALWLEADRMRSLQITDENFENQRRTVIEEKKQVYDNRPYGLATLRFEELAYENWAYAHSVIGAVEDLEKATLEDALSFHETYYGPANAILVLCGDVHSQAWDMIESHFGSISDGTHASPPVLEEPEQRSGKEELVKDQLAVLPAVYLGYHMPSLGSPEYYALSVLALVLSSGESSRLYRKLIHEKNWITHLSLGPNQYKGPELFYIWFQVQSEIKIDRVLEAVEKELDAVCTGRISETELEKARNRIRVSFVNRLSRISRVGQALADYALLFGDPETINREINSYLAVTREDVMSAAQRIFRPENRTAIVVEPKGVRQDS